jgi:hypothetical protein
VGSAPRSFVGGLLSCKGRQRPGCLSECACKDHLFVERRGEQTNRVCWGGISLAEKEDYKDKERGCKKLTGEYSDGKWCTKFEKQSKAGKHDGTVCLRSNTLQKRLLDECALTDGFDATVLSRIYRKTFLAASSNSRISLIILSTSKSAGYSI